MENSVIERFEKKYIPEPNSGCFLWEAAHNNNGYGNFFVNGKFINAHRASWMLYRGEIPENLFVLHHCDNPACVNPNHLFLGTQQQNLEDMTRKQRRNAARGEDSGAAKLTVDQVRRIRMDTRSHRVIAPEYGVGKTTIGSIKSGKYWRTA